MRLLLSPILDASIVATIALRGWSVLAGIGTLLLVTTAFTKVQQGYYYTFASLLALQIFFELGLNFVITQFVSHESIGLVSASVPPRSSTPAAEHIAGIVLFVRRWFKWIAIAFTLMVGIGGLSFMSSNAEVPPSYWRATWMVLCMATGVNLYFSPQLAIMEGLGRVKEVANLRLTQSMLGNLVSWSLLLATRELYAATIVPILMALTTPWWLSRRGELKQLVDARRLALRPINWRKQIFPMQWRIALSWVCGYLIFQLFTPTVFHYRGSVAAGQVGVSMAAITQITNISMSWITAKTPDFGRLIAEGRRRELKALFSKLFLASSVFNVFGVLLALLTTLTLQLTGSKYMGRILPFTDIAVLGVVALVNHFIFAMATFMRAHKVEPLLKNSLVTALFIAISTLSFARYSVHLVLGGYLLASALISLPWTCLLFRKFWNGSQSFSKQGAI